MKYKPLYNHDLIKLLRSFTPKEQKRFLLYLDSDYFTTRKALLSLYKELIKFHPLYRDVNCSKESLYSVVYPDLEYNGGTMRDLLSSLNEAAVEFISVESVLRNKKNVHEKIQELAQRGLHKNSAKILREFTEEISISERIDSVYFLEKYKLQVQNINLRMTFSSQLNKKTISTITDDFKIAEEYILLFSFLEITANYSNLLVFDERFSEKRFEEINIAIKDLCNSGLYRLVKRESKYNFISQLYISMLEAFHKPGKIEQYQIYRRLIKKCSALLAGDEISLHYSKLLNCCTLGAKYSKNPDYYNIELLNLYFTFLENGHYKDSKTEFIPVTLFRAIVLHAVKMKKLPWLLRVINRFSEDIIPRERENMKRFAMAFYYYASGRNGKALETIAALNITQFIFKYDIYNLRLRIYYEERNLTAALELIHSYSQFLRNDKMMPASRKAFHRAFNKYAKRLISITEGSDKFEAGLEIKKLQSENCVYKDWLTKKFSLFAASKRKYGLTG